jgi:uncharacterized protein
MARAFWGVFISFILLSSFAACVAAGPLEDATAAMERRDYATALRLLRPLSDQGNADAQLRLGVLYFVGQGVPQDFAEAVRWFQKAADQRNPQAENSLGVMYESGQGVSQDYAAALRWFQKAADQGDHTAQFNLGVMYTIGRGVLQDYAAAMSWYRKAADQGDAEAQFNVGVIYGQVSSVGTTRPTPLPDLVGAKQSTCSGPSWRRYSWRHRPSITPSWLRRPACRTSDVSAQ